MIKRICLDCMYVIWVRDMTNCPKCHKPLIKYDRKLKELKGNLTLDVYIDPTKREQILTWLKSV